MPQLYNSKFVAIVLTGILALSVVAPDALAKSAHADDSTTSTTTNDSGSIRDSVSSDQTEANSAISDYNIALKALNKAKLDQKDALKQKTLTAIIKVGDKVVTVRTNALHALSQRTTNGTCGKITDTTIKTAMAADITAEQTKLDGQKATIDAATTIDAAKTAIQAVYQDRIFASFIPAVTGMCQSERIVEFITTKITPILTKLQTAGIDVTTVTADFTKAKTDAQAAYALYAKVAANTSSTIPNPDLQNAIADMKTVKTDLQKARDDLKTAVDAFNAKNGTTSDSSTSTNDTTTTTTTTTQTTGN